MTAQLDLLAITALAQLAQAEPPLERLVSLLGALTLLLVSLACFVAYVAVLVALLPGASRRSQAALLRSPWRAFWLGLANYLFLGGIGLVLLNSGPVAFLGILIIAFLAGVTSLGLAGLALLLGERLAGLRGQSFSAWQQVVWGALGLELAGLMPVVGWFLLTPVLLMVAFGAAVLGWRQRMPERETGQEIPLAGDGGLQLTDEGKASSGDGQATIVNHK